MWVVLDNFRDEVFDLIKSDAHENTIPLTICIAPDVDAMCACRIFTCLFNKFFVQWKLVPVADYAALRELFEAEHDKEMNWLLINCGATRDLTEIMNAETHKVYLLDSHRPVHLSNVLAAGDPYTIRILDSGQTKHEVERLLGISTRATRKKHHRSKRNAKRTRREEDSYVSGEEAEDYDEENEEESANSDSPSQLFSDSEEENYDEEGDESGKRKRVDKEAAREYYKYSYYGCSSAALAYGLAEQLQHRDKDDVLWLGIVGLTDHYLNNKMDDQQYTDAILVLEEEAREQAKLNSRSCKVDVGEGITLKNEFHSNHIHAADDYRFFLLRHWSLHKSMFHSPVVAGRMGLYSSEEARDDLVTLLSKVGINRIKREGQFKDLNAEEQALLRERLPQLGAKYRLRDLNYRALFKVNGWGWTISAADLTYATTALLEEPPEKEGGDWRPHFWNAYESLKSGSSDDVARGIDLAKNTQETIVRQVSLLLAKNSIVYTTHFHYAILPETTDRTDLEVLCRPLTLARASQFILELAKYTQRGKARRRPFVLAVMNPLTNHWLLVGMMPESSGGLREKNKFGSAFRDAAEKSRSNFRYNAFEPAVIEIQKEHLRKFLDALHSRLLDEEYAPL
eukprot:TRINITY_DN2799_c0_g2_i1.p1 TRINITY_DN2799_c0_g2~~TRINITY_DN2799_c0_g2_i1.p1  ORF type:complete len:625 (-),score=154.18 TRINITY_DN2799_c0_g2_i1:129-2003(-)